LKQLHNNASLKKIDLVGCWRGHIEVPGLKLPSAALNPELLKHFFENKSSPLPLPCFTVQPKNTIPQGNLRQIV